MITKQLQDDQLASFDRDYVSEEMWPFLTRNIDQSFPSRKFSFLDIGGGNGRYADEILSRYEHSEAVVLDNSSLLIARNKPNRRKQVVLDSAERLEAALPGRTFDLISINWVLHHLVGSSYETSRANQRSLLRLLGRFLKPNGRISILENLYEGKVVRNLPSRMIYELTSSRLLSPIVSRLGANTAGCGVCFLSELEWKRSFTASGLKVEALCRYRDWGMSRFRTLGLHIKTVRVGHFWLSPQTHASIDP